MKFKNKQNESTVTESEQGYFLGGMTGTECKGALGGVGADNKMYFEGGDDSIHLSVHGEHTSINTHMHS